MNKVKHYELYKKGKLNIFEKILEKISLEK